MRRLALLTLLLAICVSAIFAAFAAASSRQTFTFEAPRDLMNSATRPGAITQLDSLGVRALRVVLTWNDVAPQPDAQQRPSFEPTDPSSYAWGAYDDLLAAAKKQGWPVLLTISGPAPKWATKAKVDHVTRPIPDAFAAFVTAVGRHYGDQVNTWSIWNEPNQPQFLLPQFAQGGRAVSPAIYRALYQAGVRGLRKAGQGNDTILLGETSPRGTSHVVAPITFLRGVLCLDSKYRKAKKCGALSPSGYAHHAYTTGSGPFFKPAGPNDVTIGVLSRLTTALDRAFKAGAVTKRLPIYLTEFGIQSVPDNIVGVSLADQVAFRAASERIAYENPRVASFSQYLLTDSDPTGPHQYGGFESGLRFANGKPKPSLAAFRLTLSALRAGSHASLWGVVRPATGSTTATITYADRGAKSFKTLRTVKTDASGHFKFNTAYRAGRRWNISWNGFAGYPVAALTP